jgi:hypothetical protein
VPRGGVLENATIGLRRFRTPCGRALGYPKRERNRNWRKPSPKADPGIYPLDVIRLSVNRRLRKLTFTLSLGVLREKSPAVKKR